MLKRVSVESILVMFLFILFTASIGLLIVEGQEAFQSIVENKNSNEDVRIGMSYINMKVKQNNLAGNIQVVESPYSNLGALEIKHYGEEEGYLTYILYDEGALYECYVEQGEPISLDLGEIIVNIDWPVAFDVDYEHSLVNVAYNEESVLAMEVYGLEEIYE